MQVRKKLVIVHNSEEESVPCALCGKTVLPDYGPSVFLADNLRGSRLQPTRNGNKAVGIVCWKCVEKHEPKFNRLLQLGHEAGVFYETPWLYVVGERRATCRPYGGRWLRLWWWENGKPPDLNALEDELIYEQVGPARLLFPPKGWSWKRVEKFAWSGQTPRKGNGWRQYRFTIPNV